LTLFKISRNGGTHPKEIITYILDTFKNNKEILMYNYVELLNPTTGHSIIADDHSDTHFFNGYTQLVRYVPNHEVDVFEQDAIREDDYLAHLAESPTDGVVVDQPLSCDHSASYWGSEGYQSWDAYQGNSDYD
jgi:hypothetical protein